MSESDFGLDSEVESESGSEYVSGLEYWVERQFGFQFVLELGLHLSLSSEYYNTTTSVVLHCGILPRG